MSCVKHSWWNPEDSGMIGATRPALSSSAECGTAQPLPGTSFFVYSCAGCFLGPRNSSGSQEHCCFVQGTSFWLHALLTPGLSTQFSITWVESAWAAAGNVFTSSQDAYSGWRNGNQPAILISCSGTRSFTLGSPLLVVVPDYSLFTPGTNSCIWWQLPGTVVLWLVPEDWDMWNLSLLFGSSLVPVFSWLGLSQLSSRKFPSLHTLFQQ